MSNDEDQTRRELHALLCRLETLHAESRALTERMDRVRAEIQQVLIRDRSVIEAESIDFGNDNHPPFH